MTSEDSNQQPVDNGTSSQQPQGSDVANQQLRRPGELLAWWVQLIVQPLLMVAAIILLIAAFGWAQRMGWIAALESTETEAEVSDDGTLYICPMVCVPPSTAPGSCPVCGMKLKAQKASGDAKDKYGLKLDQAAIRTANIKTAVAKSTPLIVEIQAIGEIAYDEGSLATISAYVDGRIEKQFADYTGVRVDEGDELAVLYSPDLYSSQVALLESIKLLRQREAASERIRDANQRLYQSSRQRLIELGLTKEQVDQLEQKGDADSRIRVVSPIAGTVIQRNAVEGQYVKTGEPIYRVADLSKVWLMLELFPRDAASIRFGQKVVTKIQSLPGREFEGRVAFVDPTVNPKTQTVRVRVVVPNEKGMIRIGDFATATIQTGVASQQHSAGAVYDPELADKWISPRHPHVIRDGPGKCSECGIDLVPASEFGFVDQPLEAPLAVVVPRNAVLMAGDQSVVYVETEAGRFEFRNVKVGRVVGDKVSIVEGVDAGETIVTSATLLVDSQFNMSGKPSLIDPTRAVSREPEVRDEMDDPEVVAALAKLTDADRALAKHQRLCPVAEELLGSMGTPIKVDVDGRPVFICCEGCRQVLLDEPAKYLAKLPKEGGGE